MLEIREITAQDNAKIAAIITQVGKEFGAIGEGFGPSDDEVPMMSEHYKFAEKSRYWVAVLNGKIVGGAGIAQFNDHGVCELRKLFLLADARGRGIGNELVTQCLAFAKEVGYESCYLDTLANMTSAIALYEKMDFNHLVEPYAETIHGGCDIWMLKDLTNN
ncbi:GNAT family N-acetyltransferase [Vibrio agarivorans]|uniref:GNAT family N-acetyltransferase n=1 Tax=Vibrio agarivorans TaxID=153622 RepID=UPI002230F617|nr:GNAT family N-acetyltransferase [Vibrio agarivorans]